MTHQFEYRIVWSCSGTVGDWHPVRDESSQFFASGANAVEFRQNPQWRAAVLQYRVRCEAILGTDRWRTVTADESHTIYSGHPQGVVEFRRKPDHTDAEILAELRETVGPHPGRDLAVAEVCEHLTRILNGDF